MALVELADRQVDPARRMVYLGDGRKLRLSTKEAELLGYLVARDRPVAWEELLAEVWGYHERVVSRAPYHTWRRLMTKLEADVTRPRHCLTVHGVGIRFRGLPPRAAPAPAGASPGLVGRADALAALDTLVGPGLTTIVGPGGVGKTRMGLAWAEGRRSAGSEVAVVDLTEARATDDVVRAVSRALGLVGPGRWSDVEQVLRHRGPTEILLDNLEQIPDVGERLGGWLSAAPALTLVGTSRRALGVDGERVFVVAPLDVNDGVELFVARSPALGAEGAAAHLPELRALVERLDGLPLAIELAAARTRVLTPSAILQRLDRRFEVLRRVVSGPDSGGERHAALWSTLTWSWDLLGAEEASALTQIAVFRGGFDLAAAEAVVDLSRFVGAPPVVDVLEGLLDHHLVAGGPARFHLLLSVRAFAEAAGDPADLAAARVRHGHWFAGWAAALESSVIAGDPRSAQMVARELDNLIAAVEGAEDPKVALRAGVSAAHVRGDIDPSGAVALADRVLAMPGLVDADRVGLLLARARGLVRIDRAGAIRDYEAASRLAVTPTHRAFAAFGLGTLLPPEQGVVVLTRAHGLFEALGERAGLAYTFRSLCVARMRLGDLEGAAAAGMAAVDLHRALGREVGLVDALTALGTLAQQRGELAWADALFGEGAELARRNRRDIQLADALEGLAAVAAERGELERAEGLLEAATSAAASVGARDLLASSLGMLGQIRLMRDDLPGAGEALVRALRVAEDAGMRRLIRYEAVLAVVDARSARLPEARVRMARVRDQLGEDRSPNRVGIGLMEVEVAVLCDDVQVATERLREAEALADELGLSGTFARELGEGRASIARARASALAIGGHPDDRRVDSD